MNKNYLKNGLKILGSWDEIANLDQRIRHQITEHPDHLVANLDQRMRDQIAEHPDQREIANSDQRIRHQITEHPDQRENHDRFSSLCRSGVRFILFFFYHSSFKLLFVLL